MPVTPEVLSAFVQAATWHGSLAPAEALLAAHPDLPGSGIHAAAILGDDAGVRRWLAADPANVNATCEPYGGDALVYLCLSKYLRLDPARSDAFLRAATALLDAGANPNTGFMTKGTFPEFETALYGAAGVAHHAGLTRLLLERGGDPNEDETPYHAPETHDLAAFKVLVGSGKLNQDSLATMLLRKADWHDYEGIKYLLEKGADPNRKTRWGKTALHNAVLSDNALRIFEVFLDHGADPTLIAERPDRQQTSKPGRSAVSMAVWRGRGDVLELFARRGVPLNFSGVERLIAACARNHAAEVQTIAAGEPGLVKELLAEGGRLLGEFAGNGNAEGLARLLDLGVPVDAIHPTGDGYFGLAKQSTALHNAAWRAQHATVKLLLARGAQVNAADGEGRTPLALAIKACVDSYWAYRRTPESIAALLAAGASAAGTAIPCGYPEADELLRQHGKARP